VCEVSAAVMLEFPPGQVINFYSLHLDWKLYGPYALDDKTITKNEQILAREKGQNQQMESGTLRIFLEAIGEPVLDE
jgi:hypothetical protein